MENFEAERKYENIGPTAWRVAYSRTLSDIPYSKEIFEELDAVVKPSNEAEREYMGHARASHLAPQFEARYKLIDDMIEQNGTKQVLELASGLAPRGLAMTDNDRYLEFAKDLAEKAGKTMLRYFGTDMRKHMKAGEQVVTIADEEINAMVIEEVGKYFPDHSVLGEEASVDKKSDLVWVCDPIDGTLPFSKGVPISCFSLALVKNGVPVIGAVCDPFSKRIYSAAKDAGAFINDRPIRVSTSGIHGNAIVNVEWWEGTEYDIARPMHQFALDTGTYVINLSCIVNASCRVAVGEYEASLFAGSRGKNVDIAAVKILVEEAGGKATDLFGNDQRYDADIKGAILSNGVFHDKLVECLRGQI